jgi:hypothetical protein
MTDFGLDDYETVGVKVQTASRGCHRVTNACVAIADMCSHSAESPGR